MGRALRPGEEVTWNTGKGETRASKRATPHGEGHEAAASADNPEYIVESDKSGKRAAHKRSALKKS